MKDFCHQALMLRGEVQDHYESHPAIGWHPFEEGLQGGEAARRSSKTRNRKRLIAAPRDRIVNQFPDTLGVLRKRAHGFLPRLPCLNP